MFSNVSSKSTTVCASSLSKSITGASWLYVVEYHGFLTFLGRNGVRVFYQYNLFVHSRYRPNPPLIRSTQAAVVAVPPPGHKSSTQAAAIAVQPPSHNPLVIPSPPFTLKDFFFMPIPPRLS
jgi:hypothetical protein